MKQKNLFWGLLLILAAVMIIVNGLGFTTGVSALNIAASVVLGGILIDSVIRMNFAGILFPIAFLCIIYARPLGISQITPWPVLLTALFGSIGLSMIFGSHRKWEEKFHSFHTGGGKDHFDQIINEEDDNVVTCDVSFGSAIKYVNAENFEKANLRASFGAMKVYFDNAQIPSGKAEINLDVSFAGMELYLPKTWKVVNNVHTSLGAVEEKNRRVEAESPVVTIRGNISFSGVEIYYV